MNKNQKGFSVFEVLAVIIVLCLLSGAGWYVMHGRDNKDVSVNTPISGMITTTIISSQKTVEFSARHPSSWEVKNGVDTWTKVLKEGYIKSARGNYLVVMESGGGGGGECQPNTDKYTLIKKIPTSTPTIFFTQYSYDSFDGPTTLQAEDMTNSIPAHKDLLEGQSSTNTCNLPLGYNVMPRHYIAAMGRMSVIIARDSSGKNELKYADIANDKEFVDMLKSVRIEEKQL